MVLQSSRDDLGGAGAVMVDQHDDRVIAAVVAVLGVVALFFGVPAVVVHDELALLEEVVRHIHGRLKQASRIAAQIENQALEVLVTQLPQGLGQLLAGVF